jgi:hypothetical protein
MAEGEAAFDAPVLQGVVLMVPRLAPALGLLQQVFGIAPVQPYPMAAQWGIEHAVLPLARGVLELCAPWGSGAAAQRFLARQPEGGACALTLACVDLERQRARFVRLGLRLVADVDEPGLRLLQLHPRDCGGCLLQFVGTPAPHADRGLPAVELRTRAPLRLADHWAAMLQAPLSREAPQAPTLALRDTSIRFGLADDEAGRDGIASVTVAVNDADAVLNRAAARGLPVEASARTLRFAGTQLQLATDAQP